MTNKEAIDILTSIRDYLCRGNPIWRTEPIHDAVNMAVDALRKTENCSEKPNNFDKDINVHSKTEPRMEERKIQGTGDCEHCSRLFVDCDGR